MANSDDQWPDTGPVTRPGPLGGDAARPTPKAGFAKRALSFLGEVVTGKVRPPPPSQTVGTVRSSHSTPAQSTLSPQQAPPPLLTGAQVRAERLEQQERSIVYLALKELLDREVGLRRSLKALWVVEQHIKAAGIKSLKDIAPNMMQSALTQLNERADYSNSSALWRLHDALVSKLAQSGFPAESATSNESLRTRVSSTDTVTAAAATAPAATLGSQRFSGSRATVNAFHDGGPRDEDDPMIPDMLTAGQGPDVSEAHGLEPFIPAPLPTFEIELDMALPSLRTK